jgi:hypothetical protein
MKVAVAIAKGVEELCRYLKLNVQIAIMQERS